jgi:hypothetical protein
MKEPNTPRFQYRLMQVSGPDCSPDERDLKNKVYKTWEGIWREVFGAVGQADALSPDEFYRQKILALITNEQSEFVGMHLYTFFDLNSLPDRNHSYFDGIAEFSFERIKAMKMMRIMSMEYLTVSPDWRKSKSGISWSDVIIGLGQKVLSLSTFDAVCGTPREGVGVDKATDRLGWITIQPEIKKYDYVCSLVACARPNFKDHPDQSIQQLIDELWTNRIDTSGLVRPAIETNKKAA